MLRYREIAGQGSVSQILTGRVVRELVTCYDSYGPTTASPLVCSTEWCVRPSGASMTEDVKRGFRDSAIRRRERRCSDIPTLILTGYFDDRTPTEQARRIAATLSRVYLVEPPNEGHDARPGSCHAAMVTQFFEDPTRRPDTSCVATIAPIRFVTT